MRTAWATAAPPPKTTPRNGGQRSRRTGENQSRRDQMKLARPKCWLRRPLMRVNIKWRSGEGAGRGGVSPRPPDQRQTIAPLGPMLLPLATVLGLTACSYVRDPAVSERHPLPAPSLDCYQNHAPLQPRTPSYVDANGQLPDPTEDNAGQRRKVKERYHSITALLLWPISRFGLRSPPAEASSPSRSSSNRDNLPRLGEKA